MIVTTIGSCGTGTDIPGITAIISCSPYVSKITAMQVFGRIRYCGKICDYYDIEDDGVVKCFHCIEGYEALQDKTKCIQHVENLIIK